MMLPESVLKERKDGIKRLFNRFHKYTSHLDSDNPLYLEKPSLIFIEIEKLKKQKYTSKLHEKGCKIPNLNSLQLDRIKKLNIVKIEVENLDFGDLNFLGVDVIRSICSFSGIGVRSVCKSFCVERRKFDPVMFWERDHYLDECNFEFLDDFEALQIGYHTMEFSAKQGFLDITSLKDLCCFFSERMFHRNFKKRRDCYLC